YAIADLYRVLTYRGPAPFSDLPLQRIDDTSSPAEGWTATEHWAACVNSENFGLGVYSPARTPFLGEFFGSPGGGEWDSATCYLSPRQTARLFKKSIYNYKYYLMVGTVDEIRQSIYELESRLSAGMNSEQTWGFTADRNFEGWTTSETVAPVGVLSGSLSGIATDTDPYLVSPSTGKSASLLKHVVVRPKNSTPSTQAKLFFRTLASNSWSDSKSKVVTIKPNSDYTEYTFDMSGVPGWTGTVTRLRLDPIDATGRFDVDWIRID